MAKQLSSNKGIFRKWIITIIAVVVILGILSDWIVEWLWMASLGYDQVFITIKETQFLLFFIAFIISLLVTMPNMHLLAKRFKTMSFANSPLEQFEVDPATPGAVKTVTYFFYAFGIIISVMFSIAFFAQWDTYFRFHWDETVGVADAIFGNDLGFYMFRLPFIELAQNSLTSLVFILTIIVGAIYFFAESAQRKGIQFDLKPDAVKHLSINVGVWLLLLSWGYLLERYQLLFNAQGVVYGAGFVDVNIKLPAIWIMFALCFLLAIFAFYQLYRQNIKPLLLGVAGTILLGVIGTSVLPTAVQKFVVEPNEVELESPYLEENIKQTRFAYKLDKIKEYSYQASDTLTRELITENQTTIDNIRLWDPRLLIQTYRQLQEIRLYYQFNNVDVDRYRTNKGYQQMMLAARELDTELPEQADTWVNRHLQYTHGYGVVMSPAAKIGKSGDPEFVIKDIPPVSNVGLPVDQPAVYYGESDPSYKLVNTNIDELDYPKGDENVYGNYAGSGGVSINNIFEKALFAWHFGDINLLLTNNINDNSKIQFWKSIQTRVKTIAPFLTLKDSPYLVLDQGKLYWIQDAYTTSPDFPYSEPFSNEYNYIRNSVKIVVDAYNGKVDFYSFDEDDPILDVYKDIFPTMFKSADSLPETLKNHVRYPQHMFEAQMQMYNTYHMTTPQVFYNNEDLWTRPNEKYGGTQIKMTPYYILSSLPNEQQLQYLQISPLTPNNRDNMIAWMAAKSDFPGYGEVFVYKLPKERLIFGPAQIEAKIDQDTEISRQLSLWDQRGSRVIRGNLMVIPVANSFIYVEPVFLIADGVDIPQLQRVIVSSGDKIAMQPTLEKAIDAIFGERSRIASPEVVAEQANVDQAQPIQNVDTGANLEQIRSLWRQAEDALQNGDWQTFGEKMDQLEQQINQNQ